MTYWEKSIKMHGVTSELDLFQNGGFCRYGGVVQMNDDWLISVIN